MADVELSSFVKKFQSLRRSGYDASLNIESKLGEIFITLSCKVGRDIPPPSPPSPSMPINVSRNRSPSYFRRQARRQAMRQNLQNSESCKSETEQVVEESADTEVHTAEKTAAAAIEDEEELSEADEDDDTGTADTVRDTVQQIRVFAVNDVGNTTYDELGVQLEAAIKESQSRREHWERMNNQDR